MNAAELQWTLPVYPQLPIEPVSGHGVMLRTKDSREILDFYGGHAVASLGYGHPSLSSAIRDQAETLVFQSNLVPLDVRSSAAEALAGFAPAGLDRVFLVNSGAEANENALRLAFRQTGRKQLVALKGGFHGRTAAAGAATWGSAGNWYDFPQTPFEVTFVEPDDSDALEKAVGPETAAIILEPIQGIAGARALAPEFLQAAHTFAGAAGAILIFDEVQCGMGRSGYPFVATMHAVTPDILTTAKGLGGGFPAGALITSDRIADSLASGDLGTTFGGGPMACAAINAVIETIRDEDLLQNVRRLSAMIANICLTGPVTAIQGAGFLLGLRTGPPARIVRDELLRRNILTGTSADPHVLRLLPPLTLRQEHVKQLAAALDEIVA
jgi:acetylornithine/succinyldiaminopimelate/putrescine aminotransferase